MIQMYTPEINRDINEEKAFEVFEAMIQPLKLSLTEMFDVAYIGPDIGRALYNAGATPIKSIWDNEHLVVAYAAWHELYKNLQTCDDLISFINVLYKEASLTINILAPLVLSFGVDVNHTIEVWWNRDGRYNLEVIPGDLKEFEDDKEAQIFMRDNSVDDEGEGFVFSFVPITISSSALLKILDDVVYPGLYYDTTVVK